MTPSLLRALGIRELYGQNVIRVNFPRHGRFQEAERLFHLANAIDEDPKRFVEAACLYRTCVKLDPSMHEAYTHLGCVYFRHGQPGIAEVAWRKAIEIDPDQPCPHFNLGYSAMCKRWNGVAAGHFRRALDADPNYADAWFNLGMALLGCHDGEWKAKIHFKKYLELEPTGDWAEEARKYL